MLWSNRFLAVSAAVVVGTATLAAIPAAAAPAASASAVATPSPRTCRANSVYNAYFALSVKRALLSCNIIELGVTGKGLPPSGSDLTLWGPDNFQHLTHADPGIYKTVWRGDHAPGSNWCASFVGDAAEICLLT